MTADWLNTPAKALDEDSRQKALQHQMLLTKPPGALGSLESLAVDLAAMQGCVHPKIDASHIIIFAADHGITAEGISAFPASVTVEMIRNFSQGGAAISVLARELGATLRVLNMGTATEMEALEGVSDLSIGRGTANFLHEAAMDEEQLQRALNTGRQAAEQAQQDSTDIIIAGDMGIGNTTSATALACALLRRPAKELVGPGTGLNPDGIKHKTAIIERALAHHQGHLDQATEILRRLGGFEIAGIVGCYIACAQMGVPALVDGFIASAAALVAVHIKPDVKHWLIFAHTSAEPGHAHIIKSLNASPILDLGMRLGEGSGAAVAMPILSMACQLHKHMATFDQAHVSKKNDT